MMPYYILIKSNSDASNRSRMQKVQPQYSSTQDRIYSRIITVQHLPIKPFPDAFPMSHPCLHNEPVAMVTVA